MAGFGEVENLMRSLSQTHKELKSVGDAYYELKEHYDTNQDHLKASVENTKSKVVSFSTSVKDLEA